MEERAEGSKDEVAALRGALRAARAELDAQALLFDQAPALMVLLSDPEHPRIERMNGLVLKLWQGRDQSGRTLEELGTDPAFVETIRRVFRTGEAHSDAELTLALDWDGDGVAEQRTFTVATQPVRDAAGRVVRVMTLSFDITETVRAQAAARASNRRFVELADAVPTIVVECDAQGRATFWNRLWTETTGLGPDAGTEAFLGALHEDDRAEFTQAWKSMLAGGPALEHELRLVVRDGTPRWYLCRVRRRVDDEGATSGYIGSLTDVDELKNANRRKDEFLAMLGHELRNPLAPIVTATELLRRRADAGREAEIIARQATHLTRLVDDLLDVSRITRGRVELRRRIVDLADIVASAHETMRPALDRDRHPLVLDVPGSFLVDGDPVRLTQVVSNLLSNAARYSDPGTTIELSVVRVGDDAEIRVRDHGVGLAPADLDRVFQLFVQIDPGRARGKGGLGIGLTLVEHLVELHGGRVEARSAGLGHGSTFIVRLPLATRGSEAPAVAAPDSASLAGVRMLVVDDNVDGAALLADYFQGVGAVVAQAHDGIAALAAFESKPPRVALVDIGLPGIDGLELARIIARSAAPKPLLVAITGYGQERDRIEALAAGFDGFFAKPVDHAAVHAFIARHVAR